VKKPGASPVFGIGFLELSGKPIFVVFMHFFAASFKTMGELTKLDA
jgi:hypothetical protein